MRVIAEKSVAVIVDVQERLFPHMHDGESLHSALVTLIQGMQILKVPMLVTEQYRKGLGPTLDTISDRFEQFEPIEKMSFSCCDDQGFLTRLGPTDAQFVILAGIEAHVCMLQTCMDLLEAGYVPVVVVDAISSRKAHDKEVALDRMRSRGALLTTTESILFELCRRSGTDQFKAISKLVK
ncbi:MAG: hydrolase [Spirochaetaceae bacterium]|nr:MAG: hydrolase [Spirochaetaceae bacterium]